MTVRRWAAPSTCSTCCIGLGLWIHPVNTILIFLVPGFFALTHTIWATHEHQKRPGPHGSLLPQVHESIKHEIPNEQILAKFW